MEMTLKPEMHPTMVKHQRMTATNPQAWSYLRYNNQAEKQEVDQSRTSCPSADVCEAAADDEDEDEDDKDDEDDEDDEVDVDVDDDDGDGYDYDYDAFN